LHHIIILFQIVTKKLRRRQLFCQFPYTAADNFFIMSIPPFSDTIRSAMRPAPANRVYVIRATPQNPVSKKFTFRFPKNAGINSQDNRISGGPQMNPSLQFIFNRRSIRKYENREIPAAMFNDLFEAAMAAPSAVARDPWHFLLIRDRKILDQVVKILPHGQMLRQAPAAVIVCGDITITHANELSYMLQDLSAAVENLLLASTALGLGSCWLGMHPRQDRLDNIRSLFSLPENIIPMCGIALGWPAEKPGPRTRFKQERVHLEKW
jgi:nitroreductase